MTNLTVSIDEALLRRARIRALERDTSVNALVRDFLEGLVAQDPPQEGIRAVLALASSSHSGSGSAGRNWTRDELYER
jgi:plasmid stability protein